jgi:predicted phage terminase large subunit-like protein
MRSAVVVIMQRLHEEDVSGQILTSGDDRWEHLMIPMKYEWDRHCKTSIGWEDPRGLRRDGVSLVGFDNNGNRIPGDLAAQAELEKRNGLLMWPQRFGRQQVAAIERELGPYFSAGRLQQAPSPKGGGIFNAQWWQLWDDPDGKFPKPIEYVVASVDGAFTEKEENDPSAMTVWGVFTRMVPAEPNTPLYEANLQIRQHRVILLHAWRKHLPISLPTAPRISDKETEASYSQRMRVQEKWGLVEWIADTCNRFKVDKLLIEAKGPGQSVVQMLQTLYGRQAWGVIGVDPKGDKVARALAVQPWFSQGLIYAPNYDWADMVITEMSQFPKGKHDDLTDSATQALSFMRNSGLLRTDEEVHTESVENSSYEKMKPRAPLYPV